MIRVPMSQNPCGGQAGVAECEVIGWRRHR